MKRTREETVETSWTHTRTLTYTVPKSVTAAVIRNLSSYSFVRKVFDNLTSLNKFKLGVCFLIQYGFWFNIDESVPAGDAVPAREAVGSTAWDSLLHKDAAKFADALFSWGGASVIPWKHFMPSLRHRDYWKLDGASLRVLIGLSKAWVRLGSPDCQMSPLMLHQDTSCSIDDIVWMHIPEDKGEVLDFYAAYMQQKRMEWRAHRVLNRITDMFCFAREKFGPAVQCMLHHLRANGRFAQFVFSGLKPLQREDTLHNDWILRNLKDKDPEWLAKLVVIASAARPDVRIRQSLHLFAECSSLCDEVKFQSAFSNCLRRAWVEACVLKD